MEFILQIENCTDRATYEIMIEAVGGEPLNTQARQKTEARRAFEATLSESQRAPYMDAVDALTDAAALREEAAVRVGLAFGVGVGAAVTAYPDQPAHELTVVAADVVASVIGSPLPPPVAHEVAGLVLRTLARVSGKVAAVQVASPQGDREE